MKEFFVFVFIFIFIILYRVVFLLPSSLKNVYLSIGYCMGILSEILNLHCERLNISFSRSNVDSVHFPQTLFLYFPLPFQRKLCTPLGWDSLASWVLALLCLKLRNQKSLNLLRTTK